ncbi:MAG: chemotaxis protein CheA, partial [bacterium]|nr:chemotaxis protein CheA [bacterium]
KALQAGAVEYNDSFGECSRRSLTILRKTIQGLSPENPDEPSFKEEIEYLEKFSFEKSREPSPAPAGASAVPREFVNPFAQKAGLLKVDFQRLDHLMNLMGELVISQTRLGRVDDGIREVLGEKGLSLELSAATEQIGKVTKELQAAIMQVRMLPLRHVFMRFPRLVSDLARDRGKEVTLKLEGQETELDKTIIDEIGEPLLHLIRNAVDHGIESPAERKSRGKPSQGTIIIRAEQESSQIIITVEDDGKGMDEGKIREKARRVGLIQEEEQEQWKLLDLILIPGFSTAETVTEISGRGIGMSVIQKSLARISGSLEVESEPGKGTRFKFKLPLTLAIIPALLVEISGEPYAIPLVSVAESVRVKAPEIHLVDNREVFKVRDHLLPLVRLSEYFGLPPAAAGKILRVVIVQSAFRQMGIVVDALLGQQDIVIRALDDYLIKSTGVSGATILGDGRVVLILDIPALIKSRGRQIKGKERAEEKYA